MITMINMGFKGKEVKEYCLKELEKRGYDIENSKIGEDLTKYNEIYFYMCNVPHRKIIPITLSQYLVGYVKHLFVKYQVDNFLYEIDKQSEEEARKLSEDFPEEPIPETNTTCIQSELEQASHHLSEYVRIMKGKL